MKLLLVFLLVISCSKVQVQEKKLNSLFADYWEESAKIFPFDATHHGDNRYNDLFPNDQTEEYRARVKAFQTNYLNRLKTFERAELSASDKISYDVFKYDLEMSLEGEKYNFWMVPFQQFWGTPLTFAQMGSGESFQPFKTVKDYQDWLSRVSQFSHWADSAIDNFRLGIKSNNVLPKVLVKKILPQLEAMVVKRPQDSLFYGPINKFPDDFSASDKEMLKSAFAFAINKELIPTYRKLHDFLKNEYLPKARDSHGISGIPGGMEAYAYLTKHYTTTDKTPEEIYQTGLLEVKRITLEMEKIKNQVGFKGSLKQFFVHLNKDPKMFPFKTSEEVLNMYRDIHKRMEPKLMTMFGRTPKTAFEIRQTEKFREASSSAEYSSGTPDGKRPGIFYLPIPDPKKFNITSGTESLFLHEAIPGHHYQISLQQENLNLPEFRKFSWFGAMGEGWALYTESLGKELGLYTDPHHYMGALGDEMHRACRLVVDVAIHTKNMTREEAIKYLMDHGPISYDNAVSEIERYMAIPGQALSYKVGAIKIQELRRKYEAQLGSKFKLSDFHDELLKDGVMPLSTLEIKMDEWSQMSH